MYNIVQVRPFPLLLEYAKRYPNILAQDHLSNHNNFQIALEYPHQDYMLPIVIHWASLNQHNYCPHLPSMKIASPIMKS